MLLTWRAYTVPFFAAILLHGLLFLLVGSEWALQSDTRRQVEPVKVVQASLVQLKPKPKPKKARPQPKPKQLKKKQAPVIAQEKPEPVKPPLLDEPSLNELLAEEDRALKAEDALLNQLQLDQQEQMQQQATQDQIEVNQYQALIRQRVSQTWKRPPGARRNMVTLLEIHMVPTGEIVSVKLKESSGSGAFDQSALLAVEKASPFDFFAPLSTRLFDANFRRFIFRFSAEDLRL